MMRLPRFRYFAPSDVKEASRILAAAGSEGAPVAGGTDLYPNMKRRHQTPKTVVSLSRIDSLKGFSGTPKKGLVLKANLTLTEVCEDRTVRAAYPGLAKAVASISTPLLRNMGTIGGNVCLDTRCNYYNQNYEWRKSIDFCMKKDGDVCWVAPGSPRCWAVSSSDSAPVLVAMGAKVRLQGARASRVIEAAQLFRDDGIRYLGKRQDEILTEIRLPALNGWKATYLKLRRRGSFDFPVLGVAACVWSGKGGVVEKASIVFSGIASYPKPAEEASAFLAGKRLDEEVIRQAAELAYHPARPLDNTDFTMHWRKQMSRVYVARALRELAQ